MGIICRLKCRPINNITMNSFYAKLDLPPKERLLNYSMLSYGNIHYENFFKMYSPSLLSKEAEEFFKDNSLSVKFIMNFLIPRELCPGTESSCVIHTDNRTINNSRESLFCSINFELSDPTDTTWTWYDMSNIPKTYREHKDSSDFERDIKLRAEVFNEKGVPDGAIPIERFSYTDKDIYLTRTDIPHMVTYDSHGNPRSSIGIRFEETWRNWDECWETFKPLMKE